MALSQMMQHWVKIKEKYKDCIIFYRLGDFYEMFFDDAVRGSELLDLTLTGRDCGLEQRAPMCGVPFHAADSYISKLVACGEKVAVCEQLEDPSQTKGIVARDVVRVVTAGTISDDSLNERANNFIACVYKNDEGVALAWADITTGELTAVEFGGVESVKKCVAQMCVLDVKEIISNDEMLFAVKDLPEITRGILPKFSSYPAWAFGYAAAERTLLSQFNAVTLDAFSVAGRKRAICASGALIEYLKETQMHALKNIDGIKFIVNEKFMTLDTTALRNLEITPTLHGGARYVCLSWFLDDSNTAMGARYLNANILYPFYDKKAIDYRLDGVQELFDATVARLNVAEMLKEIKDIERIAGKISSNTITPKDCLNLASSLSVIPNIKFGLTGFKSAAITDILNDLCDLSEVTSLIDSAITIGKIERQSGMKESGFIKQGFNAQLDELRSIVTNGAKIILEMEARERDTTGIRTLKISYNRIFGYYIEVSKSYVDKVPLHYQRRQTVANAERFITDELKELEDKILSSGELSLKLENEIYSQIKNTLLGYIDKFKSTASAIARLDLLVSFAEIAKAGKYVRPEIVDDAASYKRGSASRSRKNIQRKIRTQRRAVGRWRKQNYDNYGSEYGG